MMEYPQIKNSNDGSAFNVPTSSSAYGFMEKELDNVENLLSSVEENTKPTHSTPMITNIVPLAESDWKNQAYNLILEIYLPINSSSMIFGNIIPIADILDEFMKKFSSFAALYPKRNVSDCLESIITNIHSNKKYDRNNVVRGLANKRKYLLWKLPEQRTQEIWKQFQSNAALCSLSIPKLNLKELKFAQFGTCSEYVSTWIFGINKERTENERLAAQMTLKVEVSRVEDSQVNGVPTKHLFASAALKLLSKWNMDVGDKIQVLKKDSTVTNVGKIKDITIGVNEMALIEIILYMKQNTIYLVHDELHLQRRIPQRTFECWSNCVKTINDDTIGEYPLLQEIVFAQRTHYLPNYDDENLTHIEKLTNEQKAALLFAMRKQSTLVIGPPGSGKTFFIVSLLEFFSRIDPLKKILITAPSNQTIDFILETFTTMFPNLAEKCIREHASKWALPENIQKFTMNSNPIYLFTCPNTTFNPFFFLGLFL